MKKKISGIISILLALVLVLFFGAPGEDTAAPELSQSQIVQQISVEEPADAEVPPAIQEDVPVVEEAVSALSEDGIYTTREDVALYIYTYGHLPDNFITKDEARALGWEGGGLEDYAPGKCIGGDRFGNYEGLLPKADGRKYTECDIDTLGADSRGPKRIVFSNDGLIYYTQDHYESFELLYGEP